MKVHFSRFLRHLNRLFAGIGAAFIGALLTLGFFVLILFIVGGLKNKLEKFIANNFILKNYTALPSSASQGVAKGVPQEANSDNQQENLTYLSFTDLFSGFGWLDQSKTTLFHDYSATAFYLPPVIEWQKTQGNPISTADSFYNYSLEGVQKFFFLHDEKINLPNSFENKLVIGLSTKKLSSILLVGVVSKVGKSYLGEVFVLPYSNSPFSKPVISLSSPYPAVFGFGGEDTNWLAIYGGHKGNAYQVVNNQLKDISRLFDIRLMMGGFWPNIVYNGDYWYVYNSKESSSVRFIKLFENGTGKIQGISDLSSKLPVKNSKEMRVSIDKDFNPLIEFSGSSGREYWRFLDKGFDNSKKYEVYSLNLLGYPAATRFITISGASYVSDGAEFNWFVSTDSTNWKKIKEKELNELEEGGQRLFWKAEIIPSNNPKHSPFFEDIQLDYQVELFN